MFRIPRATVYPEVMRGFWRSSFPRLHEPARGAASLIVVALVAGGCEPVPFWRDPPDETFEPTTVGVLAEVGWVDGRPVALTLTDGRELHVDVRSASEGSSVRHEPDQGDLVIFVEDVGGAPWLRIARGDEPCWVLRDGRAWDAGDRWIFEGGLVLRTTATYERPYPDDGDGGWSSDTVSFCVDSEGRITGGPSGANF